MDNKALLIKGLDELNISYTEEMLSQFDQFYKLLIKWNDVMNLTAITEENEVIIKHFLDSLLMYKAIPLEEVSNIIDVGTGAGFPGIPLKIMFPSIHVTLMDSLNKRIKFLEEVCRELDLKKVDCKHSRAEDLARDPSYREKYDLVVSRAVSNLATLSEYCLPFARIGGNFVAYKSANSSSEIESAKGAIKTLGGQLRESKLFTIPCSDIERTYVLISKARTSPKAYPRKAGIPNKNPL